MNAERGTQNAERESPDKEACYKVYLALSVKRFALSCRFNSQSANKEKRYKLSQTAPP
jgi:hypothetical protein